MAKLIHDNGSFDEAAIAAEIEQRVRLERASLLLRGWADDEAFAQQIAFRRKIITYWVTDEARQQQWPFLSAAITALTTSAERAALRELDMAAQRQPINGDGNEAFRQLTNEADRTRRAIRSRAEARLGDISAANAA